jgi:ubiquinone/menaquinone biosynthesis C-methylase UbiE
MEEWYSELAIDHDRAVGMLSHDYQPYAQILGSLKGDVLDIGGGAGLAGAYMSPNTKYIVIDPSMTWLTDGWASIRRRLTPHGLRGSFVLGVGEQLPFSSGSFDAALSFWSLNHASNPEQCITEMHRVLKPYGRALLVLEDMEPTWADTIQLVHQRLTGRLGRHVQSPLNWGLSAKETVWRKLSGQPWPLQPDHQRIEGQTLRRWFQGRFRTVDRNWSGGFLSYELESYA